ncbi:hypothetical protein [Erwinia mallotivora]|uniref:hypothetical protein n=1 Tax=Erwinia mallotivora TaxID=69222 RepID=UPI0021BE0458|nr:hypothetical protein [Erwinia mallotivora]
MNSVKSSLARLARFVGWGISHLVEMTITGLCSVAALLSLFMFESGWLNVTGFVGAFVPGYVISYVCGRLRGER